MNTISLQAMPRSERGRHVHALRRRGEVPVVLYGHNLATQALTTDAKVLERVWQRAGRSHLVDLRVGEERPHKVLIREYQHDPRTGRPVHADFFAVNLREKITVEVPLVTVGRSPAVDDTKIGMLQQVMTHLRIECLPDRLPAQINVDVGGLAGVDDAVTVSQLSLPEGVSVAQSHAGDEDPVVVKVAPLRIREEILEAEAAAEAPAAEAGAEGATGEEAEAQGSE